MSHTVGVLTTTNAPGNVCRRFGELQDEHRCGSTEQNDDNDEGEDEEDMSQEKENRQEEEEEEEEEEEGRGCWQAGCQQERSSNAVDERWF